MRPTGLIYSPDGLTGGKGQPGKVAFHDVFTSLYPVLPRMTLV